MRTSNADIFARAGSFAFFVLWLLSAGCTRLAPGRFHMPATPGQPQICLVRGYLDWYSAGIDQLAGELRTGGRPAEAFREEQWGDLADFLQQHPHQPLVLIGFSYGADDVILIARRLNAARLTVDLLITIDPVTPADIPANVKRCVNFYEPNGFWDIFPWLRGVPVAAAENLNVRATTDLSEPDTSHATIAGNPKIHNTIRALIASIR